MDQTGLLTTGNDYCNDSLFNFLLSISESFLVTNKRAVVEQLMKSQVYVNYQTCRGKMHRDFGLADGKFGLGSDRRWGFEDSDVGGFF